MVRSRNDFGITLADDGSIFFGVGTRRAVDRCGDACPTPTIDTYEPNGNRTSIGSDYSLRTLTSIGDGEWHHVAAVRNATSGELAVYIDAVAHTCGPMGRASGGTNAACTGRPENTGRLNDAMFRSAIGWGFSGCLRAVELHATERAEYYAEEIDGGRSDDHAGALDVARVRASMIATARSVRKFPLYYSYQDNVESQRMHELFLTSVKSTGSASYDLHPIKANSSIEQVRCLAHHDAALHGVHAQLLLLPTMPTKSTRARDGRSSWT